MTEALRVLSLFSGIGAMDLGLERAGMTIAAQAEIDPHGCKVLAKRWPGGINLGDVTKLEWGAGWVAEPSGRRHFIGPVNVIAGGFPCQDISSARTRTTREGLDGDKSGLWEWFNHAIANVRPTWAIIENSPEWRRWVPRVRADLAAIGYASVPLLLQAGTFGAPHKRPRAVVVAHANGQSEPLGTLYEEVARLRPTPRGAGYWWQPRPGSVGVADGTANRMDRLRSAGNAVVPQVFERLGRAIVELDRREVAA
jgi:DNA (cytosine-5)-methyltransferase 1